MRPDSTSNLKKNLQLWLPVFAWCALIFTLSAIPSHGQTGNMEDPWFFMYILTRKVAHIIEYCVLYILLLPAVTHGERTTSRQQALLALGLCVAYAISDEWHQSWVFGRHGNPWDVIVDFFGAACARARVARIRTR